MQNNITLILVICSILLQRILFQNSEMHYYMLPFASNMGLYHGFTVSLLHLLYSYLTLPFILFYFGGRGKDLIQGYGKLLLIRSYYRRRLCYNTLLQILGALALITIFQIGVFILCENSWEKVNLNIVILILLYYYLTISCLIFMQFFLELYLDTNISNLITNLFFVISIFVGNNLVSQKESGVLTTILFPNLAFASRNGILDGKIQLIPAPFSIAIIVIIICTLWLLSTIRLRKIDIY